MTRPWGIDLAAIETAVSIWYGPDDVLSPHRHAEHLLSTILGATRHELPAGGHILSDTDLDAIYDTLLRP